MPEQLSVRCGIAECGNGEVCLWRSRIRNFEQSYLAAKQADRTYSCVRATCIGVFLCVLVNSDKRFDCFEMRSSRAIKQSTSFFYYMLWTTSRAKNSFTCSRRCSKRQRRHFPHSWRPNKLKYSNIKRTTLIIILKKRSTRNFGILSQWATVMIPDV